MTKKNDGLTFYMTGRFCKTCGEEIRAGGNTNQHWCKDDCPENGKEYEVSVNGLTLTEITKAEQFPERVGGLPKNIEAYTPIMVNIITDATGTEEYREQIFLFRPLTPPEQDRLVKCKTSTEVHELIDNIREINDPEEYDVDLRAV